MDSDQTITSESISSPVLAVFSDEAPQPSSPPSSPPLFPWDYDAAPKPLRQPPAKSAFSLLGKRKALDSISDNARPAKKPSIAKAKAKPEKAALTQMQISLGQEVQKRCKTCGMEYVPSSAEDRKLHDKFHRQNAEGYDMGKAFVRHTGDAVVNGHMKGDAICMVDCRDSMTRKKKAQAVLEIVQRDLGAVPIDERSIWNAKWNSPQEARYRSYLYVRGTRCIGYLLVEKIDEAWEVVAPASTIPPVEERKDGHKATNAISALRQRREEATLEMQQAQSLPIELSTTPKEAILGVSRIWTSSLHRRQNIATALLDAALEFHIPYVEPYTNKESVFKERRKRIREQVAFSQPTNSGARLARKWFGKTYGWSVYVD